MYQPFCIFSYQVDNSSALHVQTGKLRNFQTRIAAEQTITNEITFYLFTLELEVPIAFERYKKFRRIKVRKYFEDCSPIFKVVGYLFLISTDNFLTLLN